MPGASVADINAAARLSLIGAVNVYLNMRTRYKIALLIFLTLLAIIAVFARGPVAEHTAYHRFCDRRTFFGVANFANVFSNCLFLVVGIRGLSLLKASTAPTGIGVIYIFLFAGIVFTGFGSAFYHLSPDNNSLVFDRLPMTIVFMSLLAAIISEFISQATGAILLAPLLLAGITSVLWWHHTELAGAGDLRLYILVQYYPLLLIPLILLFFGGSARGRAWHQLGWVFGWYLVAKVFDVLDCPVWSALGIVSGHTVKHIAAGLSTWWLVRMFQLKYRM
jgi:hypothetical protein